MKYIILSLLLLTGCMPLSEYKAIDVEYDEGTDKQVTCDKYSILNCGLKLFNCTNGKIYMCMRSVEFVKK